MPPKEPKAKKLTAAEQLAAEIATANAAGQLPHRPLALSASPANVGGTYGYSEFAADNCTRRGVLYIQDAADGKDAVIAGLTLTEDDRELIACSPVSEQQLEVVQALLHELREKARDNPAVVRFGGEMESTTPAGATRTTTLKDSAFNPSTSDGAVAAVRFAMNAADQVVNAQEHADAAGNVEATNALAARRYQPTFFGHGGGKPQPGKILSSMIFQAMLEPDLRRDLDCGQLAKIIVTHCG